MRLDFEFDGAKAVRNFKKHGVSFREAMTVFDDPLAATFLDEMHSEEESRFITVGLIIEKEIAFYLSPRTGSSSSAYWRTACICNGKENL